MVSTAYKIELLEDTYDAAELDLILEKLLKVSLKRYRIRLERYERDLRAFESRYDLKSEAFSQQFEAGKLGDAIDFFEWHGVYELQQDLINKIKRLETVA